MGEGSCRFRTAPGCSRAGGPAACDQHQGVDRTRPGWTALDGFHGLALECIRWTTVRPSKLSGGAGSAESKRTSARLHSALAACRDSGTSGDHALKGEGRAPIVVSGLPMGGAGYGCGDTIASRYSAGRRRRIRSAGIARASRIASGAWRSGRMVSRGRRPVLAYLAAAQPRGLLTGVLSRDSGTTESGQWRYCPPRTPPSSAGCYDLLDPVAQVRRR